jgi:hypothetical protein
MPPTEKKIWFPAKRYGWGWGPPVCWQGWAVILAWVILLSIGVLFLTMTQHPIICAAYAIVFVIALMVTYYLKGEKPRWRWGKD